MVARSCPPSPTFLPDPMDVTKVVPWYPINDMEAYFTASPPATTGGMDMQFILPTPWRLNPNQM